MSSIDVMAIIQKSLNNAVDEEVKIDLDTHLVEDDILDSLDGIKFLFDLEEKTGVKFPDSEVAAGQLWKISELIISINSKLESNN